MRLDGGGRLLTFSAFRMGAYSRWALIRDWALIRINTVCYFTHFHKYYLLIPHVLKINFSAPVAASSA